MWRHSFRMAFRNYRRYKSTFVINVVGLSTGLACALLIFLWVFDELSIDNFHQHDDRLFAVMEHQQYADHIMTTSSTPGLLARTLKDEIPEILHAATVMWQTKFTVSVGEQNLKVRGHHAGSDFFEMFSFPLIYGEASDVLKDQSSAVISHSLAERLFNDAASAIGQMIEIEHEAQFQVSGIFQDLPGNSSHEFELILPYDRYLDKNEWLRSWGSNSPPTFVTLEENANPDFVEEKIAPFVKERNEQSNVTLFLKKFSDKYLYGRYENGKLVGGRIEYVRLFSVIAIFILLIACINFMNLSTARASQRALEVGVKKTFGVERTTLMGQYLLESLLVSFFSLVFAVLIVIVFLPTFNQITDKEIGYGFSMPIFFSFLGISLITGLLAGSYPAFYLSGFRPSQVLKGELGSAWGELWARKGLVIFQFTLSIILIVAVLVVYKQIEFVQSRNLGYEKDHLVYFPIDGNLEDQSEVFIHQARSLPGIDHVSSIAHDLIGRQNNTSGLKWEGKNPEDLILFEHVRVGYGLLETIGVELTMGRSFSKEFGADTTKVIFNETAINIMGMDDPLGKRIKLWDEIDLEIIGVVKDFHFQSLHENVKPLFFRLAPTETWVIMCRLQGGREKDALAGLQMLYEDFNPGFPFEYRFVDDEYQRLYAAEQRVSKLSRYFAGLALIISCLGLFGLAAFTGERRRKEIGIRKVLGASVPNIMILLTKDFTRLVLISLLLGLPLSFVVVKQWLGRFEYRISLLWWYFALAGAILLFISWLTVSTQAYRAAMVHPGESIKDE